jgi:hypothetical protein
MTAIQAANQPVNPPGDVAVPDPSQTADLFKAALTPQACAQAAQAFAMCLGTHPDISLRELLSSLPAQVQVAELCTQLVLALSSKAHLGHEVWCDLVDATRRAPAANPPTMTKQQAVALLVQCAQAAGHLVLTHQVVWLDILSAVPGDLAEHERNSAASALAKSMVKAGVEQTNLWKSLLQVVDKPDFAQAVVALATHVMMESRYDRSIPTADATLWLRFMEAGIAQSVYGRNSVQEEAALLAVIDAHRSGPPALETCLLVLEKVRMPVTGAAAGPSRDLRQAIWKLLSSASPQVFDDRRCILLVESFVKGLADQANSRRTSALFDLSQDLAWKSAPLLLGHARVVAGMALAKAEQDLQQGRGGHDVAQATCLLAQLSGDPVNSANSDLWNRLLAHAADGRVFNPFQAEQLVAIAGGMVNAHVNDVQLWCRLFELMDKSQIGLAEVKPHFKADRDAPLFKGAGFRNVLTAWAEIVTRDPGVRTPHKSFEGMNIFQQCNILLGLYSLPHTVEYKSAQRTMIRNALVDGSLNLASIPEVAAHRQKVRASAPSIDWDIVFNPAGPNAPTSTFSSFPALRQNAAAFASALQSLMGEAIAELNGLHKQGFPPDSPERRSAKTWLDEVLVPLMQIVSGSPETLPNRLFKNKVEVDERMLRRILPADPEGKTDFGIEFAGLVKSLQAQLGARTQKPASAAVLVAWNGLNALVAAGGARGLEHMGDYELALFNPDNARSLLLGEEVANCLSPTGVRHDALLQRFAGGWILPMVKDGEGRTVGVAFCVLNQAKELVIDFIDVRPSHCEGALANQLVEQLVAFTADVARRIGAGPIVRLGEKVALIGRLRHCDTFKHRGWEQANFTLLTPTLGNTEPLTDCVNQRTISFISDDDQPVTSFIRYAAIATEAT